MEKSKLDEIEEILNTSQGKVSEHTRAVRLYLDNILEWNKDGHAYKEICAAMKQANVLAENCSDSQFIATIWREKKRRKTRAQHDTKERGHLYEAKTDKRCAAPQIDTGEGREETGEQREDSKLPQWQIAQKKTAARRKRNQEIMREHGKLPQQKEEGVTTVDPVKGTFTINEDKIYVYKDEKGGTES